MVVVVVVIEVVAVIAIVIARLFVMHDDSCMTTRA